MPIFSTSDVKSKEHWDLKKKDLNTYMCLIPRAETKIQNYIPRKQIQCMGIVRYLRRMIQKTCMLSRDLPRTIANTKHRNRVSKFCYSPEFWDLNQECRWGTAVHLESRAWTPLWWVGACKYSFKQLHRSHSWLYWGFWNSPTYQSHQQMEEMWVWQRYH